MTGTRRETEMDTKDLWVLDGGMGRELARRGAPFRQPEWSALALMEAPETVREVHQAYVASGEPMGKAGAYAIQGAAEGLIEWIRGSHSGVMGLPLHETRALLKAAGFAIG